MGRKNVVQKRAPLEEEDEQLTHHEQEQEQESHNQEPAKQTPECISSEDEEEQDEEELEVVEEQKVEKVKSSVQKPINPKKPQHPRSSDSDPGSDSETHLGSPTASGYIIKSVTPQPKKPTSGKRLVPEFERKAYESSRKKKKAKVFEEAAEKKKSGVGAINRLWSEEDEVAILERLMDFKSDMGGLYEVIKKSLSVDASKSQFLDKIRKLKIKYRNNVERGGEAVLSTPHEHKCFELSKKTWGGGKENKNGGDGNGNNVGKKARKTVKRDDAVALPEDNDGKESALGEENKNGVDGNGKSNGTKRARKKTVKLDDVALPREESGEGEVASGEGSKGGEMKDMKADKVGDFWATHPCLKQSLAMEKTFSDLAMKEPVKSFMMENMSMIGDVKAKELEKKWKDFYADEAGLYLKRVELMEEQTKLVLVFLHLKFGGYCCSPYSATILVSNPQQEKLTAKADLIFEDFIGIDLHENYTLKKVVDSNVIPKYGKDGNESNISIDFVLKGIREANQLIEQRRRMLGGGYDLDMSYIIDRLLAMSFPAERMRAVYRNPLWQVKSVLDMRHQGHYKVYNLCIEEAYDPSHFHGRVERFPMDDNHVPPLKMIKNFCESVYSWLSSDPKNIAVVHCMVGKGRTGMMVCAYLVYSGMSVKEALQVYAQKRTTNNEGVSHTSSTWDVMSQSQANVATLELQEDEVQVGWLSSANGLRMHLVRWRGESILDAIFDDDSLEDVLDVEMMDVEEGGLVGHDLQIELGQTIGGNDIEVNQVSASKNRRYNKKKNRREKASSGPKVTDINRFFFRDNLSCFMNEE
ncbi:hypothetical protein RHGRI_031105 [Rhododendron griersonianum]|uniref:Uncharacterized protein n=1 Tax=Rhododendron griersonianum TaxID=479676 RepID=A0AAV6I916_9ERIC|nr:hypothetical protein RHGRI_031105 [Rhododendron griersonianum]